MKTKNTWLFSPEICHNMRPAYHELFNQIKRKNVSANPKYLPSAQKRTLATSSSNDTAEIGGDYMLTFGHLVGTLASISWSFRLSSVISPVEPCNGGSQLMLSFGEALVSSASDGAFFPCVLSFSNAFPLVLAICAASHQVTLEQMLVEPQQNTGKYNQVLLPCLIKCNLQAEVSIVLVIKMEFLQTILWAHGPLCGVAYLR